MSERTGKPFKEGVCVDPTEDLVLGVVSLGWEGSPIGNATYLVAFGCCKAEKIITHRQLVNRRATARARKRKGLPPRGCFVCRDDKSKVNQSRTWDEGEEPIEDQSKGADEIKAGPKLFPASPPPPWPAMSWGRRGGE